MSVAVYRWHHMFRMLSVEILNFVRCAYWWLMNIVCWANSFWRSDIQKWLSFDMFGWFRHTEHFEHIVLMQKAGVNICFFSVFTLFRWFGFRSVNKRFTDVSAWYLVLRTFNRNIICVWHQRFYRSVLTTFIAFKWLTIIEMVR